MKLYFAPGACSLAAHICLREAGLDFELVKTDLRTKRTEAGRDFVQINPKGYVPALELDDGAVLTENAAVLRYIADQTPATDVAPAPGSLERYRLAEWLAFVNSEIHKSFSPFFNPATPDAYKDILRGHLSKRLSYVQGVLELHSFLMGEPFTVADAYLYTVLRWSDKAGLDLGQWSAIQRYCQVIAQRPRVTQALKTEGLI